jgi:hypothetical protein
MRARVCSAADATAAVWASVAASPAAPPALDAPIAEASAPAAAITPAAAASAAAGVTTYVADKSATRELAAPAVSPAADIADSSAAVPDPDDTPIGTIPPNLLRTLPDADAAPPSTVEIAPAVPPPQAAVPPAPVEEQDSSSFASNPEIRDYEQHQEDATMQGPPGRPGQAPMQIYATEDAISSPIGIQLREARRTLKSGEEADGLLITEVTKGSPAAAAGLHAFSRGVHNALTGAIIVAGLVFPPAILGVPLLDYTQVGESYDMIIGVDGSRVTNFLDFEDQMRDLKPGEIVYLSVVRDGRRIQFRVELPAHTTLATW